MAIEQTQEEELGDGFPSLDDDSTLPHQVPFLPAGVDPPSPVVSSSISWGSAWLVGMGVAVLVALLLYSPIKHQFFSGPSSEDDVSEETVSLEDPKQATGGTTRAPPSDVQAPLLEQPFPATVVAKYPEPVNPAALVSPWHLRTAEGAGVNYVVFLERAERNVPFVILYMRPGQSVDMGLLPGRYRVTVATGDKWYGEDRMFGDPRRVYVKRDLLIAEPHVRRSVLIQPTFELDVQRR